MKCMGVQRANFHKKLKIQRANFHQQMAIFLAYLCIFHGWLLKFCVVIQNPQNFTIIAALVYRGIPSDLRSRPQQSHRIPGALLLGDYRQSIESSMGVPTFNSTEKALTFTVSDCILRIPPKKVCYFTKDSPLDVELI